MGGKIYLLSRHAASCLDIQKFIINIDRYGPQEKRTLRGWEMHSTGLYHTHTHTHTHTGSVITAGRLHYSHSRSVKCCPGVSGRSMASTVSQSTQPCQTSLGSEVTLPDGPEGVAALRGWHHHSDPSIPRRGNGVLMPCWWRAPCPRGPLERNTQTQVCTWCIYTSLFSYRYIHATAH